MQVIALAQRKQNLFIFSPLYIYICSFFKKVFFSFLNTFSSEPHPAVASPTGLPTPLAPAPPAHLVLWGGAGIPPLGSPPPAALEPGADASLPAANSKAGRSRTQARPRSAGSGPPDVCSVDLTPGRQRGTRLGADPYKAPGRGPLDRPRLEPTP